MKKIYLILISTIMLVGCSLGNTPTSRVEALLSDYQMLNNNISISYNNLTTDSNLNQNIINRYEDAIRKQYRELSYEIKEEQIDGKIATVTIQVEVMNYKEAINKYDRNDYEITKYHELILSEIENTKETTTYTLDITLTQNNNGTWYLDNLTEENKNKLLGMY